MLPVGFFRKNVLDTFKSSLNSSQVFKYNKFYESNQKEEKRDPYEGNYGFTDCDQSAKVTLIGAAGRVGRTLSLLLKTCPLVDHLCLFDVDRSVKGIGVDVSHIDTKCCVSYVCGMKNIQKALENPDVVVIAAGYPTSPKLDGKKLFERNAPIIASLSECCAKFCPQACVVLITNPINSLVPLMSEIYQAINRNIPSEKLFGLTTLDVVRANTFVGEVVRKDPNSIIVPVIGGASQDTIVPVISQMKPCYKIKRNEALALTECIKRAEGNLSDCQNCGTRGASSLSTAYAAFRFTSSLVMALKGAENVIECAYVKSNIIPEIEYMASPLKLGICGIEHNFGYPRLSDFEVSLMEQAAPILIKDINMGKCYVVKKKKKKKNKNFYKRCSGCENSESICLTCSPRRAPQTPSLETKMKNSGNEKKIVKYPKSKSYFKYKKKTSEIFNNYLKQIKIDKKCYPIEMTCDSRKMMTYENDDCEGEQSSKSGCGGVSGSCGGGSGGGCGGNKNNDYSYGNLWFAGDQCSVWCDEENVKNSMETNGKNGGKCYKDVDNNPRRERHVTRKATYFNTLPLK